MTTNLTQRPESNLELWQDVFINAIQWTEQELGYSIPLERLDIQPDLLPPEEQQAIERYEFTLYDYAKQDWQSNEERCRLAQAKISQREQERKMLWLACKKHQDVIELGKEKTSRMQDSSSKRTIDAFYNRYYDDVVAAGVEPGQIAELSTRPDKFLINTERAIARTVKSDLTQPEKDAKIREIVDDATTLPFASEIRKKHLNGHAPKLPRDILWLEDGTRLVTFICDSDDAFLELDKKTGDIVLEHGNVEPIILATKDERIRNEALTDLKCVLAIIQAGDLDAVSTSRQVDILNVLKEYGYAGLSSSK